jgi:hypothetical protein
MPAGGIVITPSFVRHSFVTAIPQISFVNLRALTGLRFRLT